MTSKKILLHENVSKTSSNENNSLTIDLKGSERLLPIEPILDAVNEMEQYNTERLKCNTLRLNFSINTICSNVCFNNITEIVKNEGSDNVIWLNYEGSKGINNLVDKIHTNAKKLTGKTASHYVKTKLFSNDNKIGENERVATCIRDTQLSSSGNGFTYHCGLDICNNHILRSKTFKTVANHKEGNPSVEFNTIGDYLRHFDGENVKFYKDYDILTDFKHPTLKAHVYLNEEINSFMEEVTSGITEYNGWVGFKNSGSFPMFNGNKQQEFNKVICDRKTCDFIDFYPERDLFYFTPKYNKYKNRIEKNWNYCLTYPSSSTTDISFIETSLYNGKPLNSLKIHTLDDTISYTDGRNAVKINSISQHGLKKGDYINLYKTYEVNGEYVTEKILSNVKVLSVIDKYSFYIYREGKILCNKWYELKDEEKTFDTILTIDGEDYKISQDIRSIYNVNDESKKYYLIDKHKINLDATAQNFSFKRVIDGYECEYYVRIFSRLPNWKFADKKPTFNEIYNKNDDSLLRTSQLIDNEFENHVGHLAFARNIYNDEIAEITFSDDIDISNLKDNLGRPLTDLYLTIIKNNAGYREWYGKDKYEIELESDRIEFSHCFGKNTCAFRLSIPSLSNLDHSNILVVNNIDNKRNGLDITKINITNREVIPSTSKLELEDDEIEYNKIVENGQTIYSGDTNFYGDLCCYSSNLCAEESIQQVENRFNTTQRELTNLGYDAYSFLHTIFYDEIVKDDFDTPTGFELQTYRIDDANQRKEGYCYYPHYKIPVKSFSRELKYSYPIIYNMEYFENIGNGDYIIKTTVENGSTKNRTLGIYDIENGERYICTVTELITLKRFKCHISKQDGSDVNFLFHDNVKKLTLFYRDLEEIPEYATFIYNGSCMFKWREALQNGFDDNSDNEVYPYTNNALYINKNIRLFVKRQDPHDYSNIQSDKFPYDYKPRLISVDDEDNYYNENDIEC